MQTLSAATSTAAPGHLPAFMAGPNGADLYAWTATVSGPSGSPYSRGLFFFDIRFPGNYPFSPPVVVLRSRIYHPNLVAGTTVAIRTLSEDGWSAATTVYDVLRGIRELLAEPDPHDAVVGSVAEQYVTVRVGVVGSGVSDRGRTEVCAVAGSAPEGGVAPVRRRGRKDGRGGEASLSAPAIIAASPSPRDLTASSWSPPGFHYSLGCWNRLVLTCVSLVTGDLARWVTSACVPPFPFAYARARLQQDRKAFDETARDWTRRFAS